MAIIADYTGFRNQFFPGQYIRIDRVTLLSKNEFIAEAGIYFNKEYASQGNFPHSVEVYRGDYDLYSNQNIWQLAYDMIKPSFPDYVDDL